MKKSAFQINKSRKRKFVEKSVLEIDKIDLSSEDTQKVDNDFVIDYTYISKIEYNVNKDCYDSNKKDNDFIKIVVDNQKEILKEDVEDVNVN